MGGGTLRDEEYYWMQDAALTADLVIVLGTSLGGLNADQVATRAANRSLRGSSLGTVCINLQQTPEDGRMSLRIFGTSDKVLTQVCKSLGEDLARNWLGRRGGAFLDSAVFWTSDVRALVPYNASGHLVQEGEPWMWLDLSSGKEVRMTEENNLWGCQQPSYRHFGMEPGEMLYGVERVDAIFSTGNLGIDVEENGLVTAVREGLAKRSGAQSHWIIRKIIVDGVKTPFSPQLLRQVQSSTARYTPAFDVPRICPATPLSGTVSRRDDAACCFVLEIGGSTFHFGIWWLEAAARGALKMLPITNTNPAFCVAPGSQ